MMSRKPCTLTVRLTEEQRARLDAACALGPYRVALTEIIARGIELAAAELEQLSKQVGTT